MKIKTFKQYRELALRSIKNHDSEEIAIADWALGLGGEASEVLELLVDGSTDKMEIAKELGDVLWYATALGEQVGALVVNDIFEATHNYAFDRSHCAGCILDSNPIQTAVIKLSITIGSIQEMMKHTIMHKERFDKTRILVLLGDVHLQLATLATLHRFTIFDVAELNAAKLAHRFNLKNGGSYSHEASAKRHDAEILFEHTKTYKQLYSRITGNAVVINPDDVEVL